MSSLLPLTKASRLGNPLLKAVVSRGLRAFSAPPAKRPVYLDYQATTPVDPRVATAMNPFWHEKFGNPHSKSHAYGWEAEDAVEQSRKHVASLVGAKPKEIIFTSGATESNNMAVKGVPGFYRSVGGKKHIISTQVEHKCVLASCRWMESQGFEVTYLPVDEDGVVDPQAVAEAIRPDTALVSVMLVNNEIGVIQDIKTIGEICRKKGVYLHTDAAQAVGKIPVDVEDLGVDLMSISAHKLYGPKGVGALYVRSRPRVRLVPVIHGGGQERGLRSGTLPAPIVVGFGEACRIAKNDMGEDLAHVTRLSKRFEEGIRAGLDDVKLNGSRTHRYPGNVNLSFSSVEGESLLMSLKEIAVSSGSACTSASLEPSYVLRAIGVDEELAHTSIRFGIGRFTTEEEIDHCVNQVVKEVLRLRAMSPLWEMAQGGGKQEMVWT